MSDQRIIVLGGGFAGLWSAVGAVRKLDALGQDATGTEVLLINRDEFHNIRVRNYEADLTPARVPLAEVLDPIGVRHLAGDVANLDLDARLVTVQTAEGQQAFGYDRLVFALGSQVLRPDIPGLADHAFDIDTYGAALRLETHLQYLPDRPHSAGQYTVVVVGAGLTGIESAAEMPARLRAIQARAGIDVPIRVILADHAACIGSDMGESARAIIEQALAELGVETMSAVEVAAVDADGLRLGSGDRIAADTVVWCAGMRASPLTAELPVKRDHWGRLPVDQFMRVEQAGKHYWHFFNTIWRSADLGNLGDMARIANCHTTKDLDALSDRIDQRQLLTGMFVEQEMQLIEGRSTHQPMVFLI